MPLHMIKLCVGVETVDDLEQRIADRLRDARNEGRVPEQVHITRVMPKRVAEIVDGGSLFWVIKGHVQVRQPVVRFDAFTGEDGIERCRIVLRSDFLRTSWQPRRPFQGWRYLKPEDAPPDAGAEEHELPDALKRELVELGLL